MTYFAAASADEAIKFLNKRSSEWIETMVSSRYTQKLKELYASYHGAYYTNISSSHQILFSGEQGELVNLSVNHLRNFGQHMLVMTTSTRPTMEARAVNTDYKSLAQTHLANGLLDYYMREKRLEKYLRTAVEYSIVLGAGYVKMEWNNTTGEVYDYNLETGAPIYEGDVEFSNLSPMDVIFDTTKPSWNHDWIITRSRKNKYDIAAKYPEFSKNLENFTPAETMYDFHIHNPTSDTETDDVYVFEFYHKRSEALPNGRYMMYVDEDVVLYDGPLPYRTIPVFRIAPSDILGTVFGYTPLMDFLPIQESINSLYSTVMTNQNAFGVQNIYVPRGADISVNSLMGGLNIIEGNANAGKPEPLNLTNTPREVFDFIKMLEAVGETIMGISSVTRGNPEPNLRSGNAMALLQSQSLQFMSGLQQQYVQLIEDVGTALVNMLKDFAEVPRVAAIVGKNNRTFMKQFKGEDLKSINRVIVDMGNPMSRCLKEGTEVLMFDGSKRKVEEIKVGDWVMGPDSSPRTVKAMNSGKEEMYDIFHKSKKSEFLYGCNESHILTLRYCSDDYRYDVKKGDVIDITVRDYLKLPARHKRLLQGFRVGVNFEPQLVKIPAYILGAWLGDGHSATTALTTMDSELLDAWTNYAQSIGLKVRLSTNKSNERAKTYFITSGNAHGISSRNSFMNELRAYNLINNKHIPDAYLKNNEQTRLELLAGLIDTDGTLLNETFVFTQKSNVLADQVEYLAKSLGFRVTRTKRPSDAGPNSDRRIIGEINSITIGGDTHRIPCKLPRKQAKQKTKARNWLNYGIKVVPVGFGTYYGFTLKEEPHFLLGDFTVTHNTTAGKLEMAEQLLQMGAITKAHEYITVMNTGKLESMTEDDFSQNMLIKGENEKMVEGIAVPVLPIDSHILHIQEHSAILADPELRMSNPEILKVVLDHIQEHINSLEQVDPRLLQALGQQPLNAQPAAQGTPEGIPPVQEGNVGMSVSPNEQGQMQIRGPGIEDGQTIPSPATPPAPFNNSPMTADEAMGGFTG